jgi:minor extracellular serine protease Vpr
MAMHRRLAGLLAAGLLLLTVPVAQAGAPPASSDSRAAGAVLDTRSAIVVLKEQPVATYDGHVAGFAKTRPSSGKLNPNSAAVKKYLGYLKNEHSAFADWLRANAPGAKVTSDFSTVLNGAAVELNGTALRKLLDNPDVASVEYNALYRPSMSESHKIINAGGAWAASGGRADAGRGIKVGVIDTGIDATHPFFDPSGFVAPPGFPKCDARDSAAGTPDTNCKFTSAKVIVAKVFNEKLNQNGFDARPAQDHGTHVAGTVAGVTGKVATVQGVVIDDMSGVAPAAWLGNYNVFPGNVTNARSEDIINAVEQAVTDGMDVLNLSLGGGFHGNNDLLAKGLDNAVAAGVTVAVAAGNSGPGPQTIESPGRARDIITAGASTNQHFVGQPLTYPAGGGTTIGAAVGDFPALAGGSYALFDTGSDGCASVAAGASGKLAIINRGACTFSAKVRNAIAAGAVAVLVVNNVAGDPTAMAKDGLGGDNLPAVMIGSGEGAALRASGATTASALATFSEFITPNKDILAGFSSQGPTTVDLAIKPDLTSVGVNVLSSVPCTASPCNADAWAFFSGTSMATPHIAGSAAVLLALHPTWSPATVKSALVNTADRVVTNAVNGVQGVGPNQQGGGRENLSNAALAGLAIAPVSASFGKISGSVNTPTSLSLKLTNSTATSQSFSLTAARFTPAAGTLGSVFGAGTTSAGDGRISFPASVTVPANGSTTLKVTVNANLGLGTVVQGWITLDGGAAGSYHFGYYAAVGP